DRLALAHRRRAAATWARLRPLYGDHRGRPVARRALHAERRRVAMAALRVPPRRGLDPLPSPQLAQGAPTPMARPHHLSGPLLRPGLRARFALRLARALRPRERARLGVVRARCDRMRSVPLHAARAALALPRRARRPSREGRRAP